MHCDVQPEVGKQQWPLRAVSSGKKCGRTVAGWFFCTGPVVRAQWPPAHTAAWRAAKVRLAGRALASDKAGDAPQE